MNALYGVWLNTCIVQIIIQEDLEMLTNYMETNYILRYKNFQSNLEIFKKLKESIPSALLFLVMKIKNIQSIC